ERGNISPTTDLVGLRPPSTTGSTSSTGMRPIGSWPKTESTDRSGASLGRVGVDSCGVVESSVTGPTLPVIRRGLHVAVDVRDEDAEAGRGGGPRGARGQDLTGLHPGLAGPAQRPRDDPVHPGRD